jgi:hypothetical protein
LYESSCNSLGNLDDISAFELTVAVAVTLGSIGLNFIMAFSIFKKGKRATHPSNLLAIQSLLVAALI